MGAGCALDFPAYASESGEHVCFAMCSYCRGERDFDRFRWTVTRFDPFREYAKGQGLGASDRFVSTLSVLHDAGKLDDLGDPAPVFLCFGLNRESHLPFFQAYAETAVRSVTGAVWPMVKSFLPQTSRPRASQIGRSLKFDG